MKIHRQEIVSQLERVLEPRAGVHALWLEGADALGRVDAYSDLDLWLDVDAEHIEDVLALIQNSLTALGNIDLSFEDPHPDPDIRQIMFHLTDSSPFLLIDICIQRHGRDIVLDPHADAVKVLFDRSNVIRFEARTHDVTAKIASLQRRFELKQLWVKKELARANFYRSHHELSCLHACAPYHLVAARALPCQSRFRQQTHLLRST